MDAPMGEGGGAQWFQNQKTRTWAKFEFELFITLEIKYIHGFIHT